MISSSLGRPLQKCLEWRTSRVLEPNTPLGELSDAEHLTIHALLQVIADDLTLERSVCRQFVNEKTRETTGALDAYRRAARLLEASSHRHLGADFSKASLEERDWLLRRLFIQFPHEERLPLWARRLRLLPHKLSLLVEVGAFRLLRHHVMPELLSWYYTTERGWAVVGCADFPGKARGE